MILNQIWFWNMETSTIVVLAAFHNQIKIGHIEPGLRTYYKTAPFPEEIIRLVTDSITDYFFTTSKYANENL